ncbi:unnamed protein product [Echinostoma caproni]|uniref:Integrase catalytic domain-containing protein n=1 Tax=Echinostoma caproni TaxID=27848 RepID=A0A183B266_9TREM|nr:unnamed protein product [Echinostoma caproni]
MVCILLGVASRDLGTPRKIMLFAHNSLLSGPLERVGPLRTYLEVYFTTTPSSEFTIRALRKTFSREGVSHAIVTDTGSHFTAKKVTDWLNSVSCQHVLTPPQHPQSNGAAENFVRTLKSAIASLNPSTFDELDRGVDNFLMQYRNAVHSTTGHSPAKLFKSRVLRTNLLRLESAEVVYRPGTDLRPSRGIVLDNMGQRVCRILDLDDGTAHRRHVGQRNYIPVHMSKTVQNDPEDLNDYSTTSAVITEDRSFIQVAADVVIAHEP